MLKFTLDCINWSNQTKMDVLPRMWRNIVSSALMCVLLISVDDKEINYISNKLLIILHHIAWKDYNVGIK